MRLPYLSVVIPTYSRIPHIRECVRALAGSDYPKDRYEVIVVDDGSPDPASPHLEGVHPGLNLRCLRQQQSGPATARNLGLIHASGDLVAFTDDDCKPRPEWLPALAQAHEAHPEAGFSGPVRNGVQNSVAAETSQILIDYCIRYFDLPTTGRGFFTSNNMGFPRKQLVDLGGFSTSFPLAAAEDRDVCARWTDAGYGFIFVERAVVDHFHDLNVRRFVRQQFNYGRGAWYFQRARAKRNGDGVRVEPVRFYSGMLGAAFRHQRAPRSFQVCGLLILSQAMTAAGFFSERRRNRG